MAAPTSACTSTGGISAGPAGELWGNSFRGINAANRVIYQIESGTLPITGDAKVSIPAELRAVRAYDYSLLLDNFGNVPIVTDFTSTDLPTQSTRQQVYDFVVKQLTDVIPLLSDATGSATTADDQVGGDRAPCPGVPQRRGVHRYAAVRQGAHADAAVIDGEKYSLDASYRAPFARNNDKSKENIWAVPYDAINAPESSFHMKTLKPELRFVFNMQAQPWGGSASNPQFIDTYDPNDERLKDTWLMGPQFDGAGHGYDFVKFVPSITKTDFNNGFPVWKYEIYAGETGSSDVDYPIIRYAEVLMMRAEALLRTGQRPRCCACYPGETARLPERPG